MWKNNGKQIQYIICGIFWTNLCYCINAETSNGRCSLAQISVTAEKDNEDNYDDDYDNDSNNNKNNNYSDNNDNNNTT